MKSATSTLHHILSRHESVYIPDKEVHFFSLDDITEHPTFFRLYDNQCAVQDYRRHFETYFDRYKRLFGKASSDQVVGEHSTVYLASEKAPSRIAESLPNVQLIFLLRDPVERAYSHYYHALRAGRAIFSFEDALQYGPRYYITRGFYREQVERYLKVFDRDRLAFLIFEDFVQNLQKHVDGICDWIGLSGGIDLSTLDTTRSNVSHVPRWPKLMTWQNYLFRSLTSRGYQHPVAELPRSEPGVRERILSSLNYRLRYANLKRGSRPQMGAETRRFLQDVYARENDGLSELIETDVSDYWKYM